MKGNLDSYREKYKKFAEMLEAGLSLSEISRKLGVPKSTLSYWKSRGRNPTSVERMERFLEEKGPMPVYAVAKTFPKHSEIYNRSAARGGRIRKFLSSLKGSLSAWYYLEGQEKELEKRIREAESRIEQAKDAIRKVLSEER